MAQFRDQTQRYLNQELTEDQFRPFRLQNGLYVQRYGANVTGCDSLRHVIECAITHLG